MQREFSEPLIWHDSDQHLDEFRGLLVRGNLNLTQGGRFMHILGATNKGHALNQALETGIFGDPTDAQTIALGDSANDLEMLKAADIAVVINNPHSDSLTMDEPATVYTDAAGPRGWNEAITTLFDRAILND